MKCINRPNLEMIDTHTRYQERIDPASRRVWLRMVSIASHIRLIVLFFVWCRFFTPTFDDICYGSESNARTFTYIFFIHTDVMKIIGFNVSYFAWSTTTASTAVVLCTRSEFFISVFYQIQLRDYWRVTRALGRPYNSKLLCRDWSE